LPRFEIQKHAASSLHYDFRLEAGGALKSWIEEGIEQGHATFWLEGRKLRGGWSLRRIADGADERWLLVKKRDDEADARRNPVSTQPESVLSGRTIEEVREREG
jgi:hypothetical protein